MLTVVKLAQPLAAALELPVIQVQGYTVYSGLCFKGIGDFIPANGVNLHGLLYETIE